MAACCRQSSVSYLPKGSALPSLRKACRRRYAVRCVSHSPLDPLQAAAQLHLDRRRPKRLGPGGARAKELQQKCPQRASGRLVAGWICQSWLMGCQIGMPSTRVGSASLTIHVTLSPTWLCL
ncbi:hypothetical protein M441DRAFT_237749 [Trichoderma asperellum CBS 433.97]|uniref:Uncharacterized protein n=1 Tax=Trichoderma asperellum (strain ATCC 204424 / CBS 433.97 / NBRC 101777) TaxID=1042311 RepID=A0A2T3Z1P3_TRIA4|nr:hypothetical protein M441DRAFT_237749 [Trichoderma asperellum CBS 433.97]PTB38734.1 hypothetical protein M441DRAFT_237749 [Trichoderma asperellum CBS 433.97]WVH32619.1 hypothetical protein [Trichoderma asperellum]